MHLYVSFASSATHRISYIFGLVLMSCSGFLFLSLKFLLLQEVEIVLTAHPTQINRRTLQYKHIRIAVSCDWLCLKYVVTASLVINRLRLLQHLLDYNDRPDLSHEDREMLIEDLVLFLRAHFLLQKCLFMGYWIGSLCLC